MKELALGWGKLGFFEIPITICNSIYDGDINRSEEIVSQYPRGKSDAKIRGRAELRLWHARLTNGGARQNWPRRSTNRRHIKRYPFKGAILFSPEQKGYHRRDRICLITGGEAEFELCYFHLLVLSRDNPVLRHPCVISASFRRSTSGRLYASFFLLTIEATSKNLLSLKDVFQLVSNG